MSDEKKRCIKETVEILKGLDKQSLLLLKTGAEMLKAHQDMSGNEDRE